MSVYKIFKLARKFEFKLALAVHYTRHDLFEEINSAAAASLNEYVIHESLTSIKSLLETRKKNIKPGPGGIASPLSAGMVASSRRGLEGILNLNVIRENLSELYKKENNPKISYEKIYENLLTVSDALNNLLSSSGTDRWGTYQSKFLYLYDIFSIFDTSQNYGTKGFNTRAFDNILETKIRPAIKALNVIVYHVEKAKNILDNLSSGNLEIPEDLGEMIKLNVDDFEPDFGIKNWHEQAHFCRILGLDRIPGMSEYNLYVQNARTEYSPIASENAIWNEFIAKDEELKKVASKVWYNSKFRPLWKRVYKQDEYDRAFKDPTIASKTDYIKNKVTSKLGEAIERKNTTQSMQFGSPDVVKFIETEEPMGKKIKPPAKTVKRVRYDLEQMGDTEKLADFDDLDIDTQLSVAQGKISLEEAIGENKKIIPAEEIMKPLLPLKPLSPAGVQDLVNTQLDAKSRMAWLREVKPQLKPEELSSITGVQDIINLINKYTDLSKPEQLSTQYNVPYGIPQTSLP